MTEYMLLVFNVSVSGQRDDGFWWPLLIIFKVPDVLCCFSTAHDWHFTVHKYHIEMVRGVGVFVYGLSAVLADGCCNIEFK